MLQKKATVQVILGAALWGMIGLFVKGLYAAGLTSMQIVALRAVVAGAILFVYTLVTDRRQLRIDWRDLPLFIGTGGMSIVFFNWCYFTAIRETSVSMAVILLYTAPAMVTILSRIFYRELFTWRKSLSLLLAMVGLVVITGAYRPDQMNLSAFGLATGLGAGFGYALYSVIGRLILRKYEALTMTVYTFFLALLLLSPVLVGMDWSGVVSDGKVLWLMLGLGLMPTAMAYIFYTRGLVHLETSRASIVATIEPVVATLIGVVVFAETLSILQWGGVGCILLSVGIVSGDRQPVVDNKKDLSAT